MEKLPNMKQPCSNCPFRKDIAPGWLGANRMAEIINSDSFVCHKTTSGHLKERKQCAGHMVLMKERNYFYRLANRLNAVNLVLAGEELVFDTPQDCINHHSF